MSNTAHNLVAVAGSVVVLAVSSPYTLITLALSVGILFYIGKRYTATSSQLRTLQMAAQAPVTEYLRAAFDGRCTIRAFGLHQTACRALVDAVHQAQKSAYLFRSLQAWLVLMLNLVGAGIAGTLAALVVGLKSRTHVGWAGVALVNTIALGRGLDLVMHWLTTLEVLMGAIQRIREFITTTPAEDDGRVFVDGLPADWPRSGHVVFEDVSCSRG